jgi:CII-binding regulator of phage lambda lysogenization HflD
MATLKPPQYKKQISDFLDSLMSLNREFENAIEYFKDDKEIIKQLKRSKEKFAYDYHQLISKTLDDNSKYFALTQI